MGNTLNLHQDFIKSLSERVPGLKETSVEECDAVLVFCPVVSRAGTDISAALQKLYAYKESKPTVLVILHQTLNPELTAPDSSSSVNRENTLTVDCLFQEDKGLLRCYRNQEALDKVTQWIRPLVQNRLKEQNEDYTQREQVNEEDDGKRKSREKELKEALGRKGTVFVCKIKPVWIIKDEDKENPAETSAETSQIQSEQQETDGDTVEDKYDWPTIQSLTHKHCKSVPKFKRKIERGRDQRNYLKLEDKRGGTEGQEEDMVMMVIPELEHVTWVPKSKVENMVRAQVTEDQQPQ
ncbi:uncharacterized protein LOC103032325 [Astyanax mexicanus]|uniref:uncharacterized protein LOC103032325 n=1 Tax=Astyanax mexicanus TaxID=7994 RepID=UPI0020CB4ED2|nr:uncharacterized protein LOC103032325 [Astyanax mexicanus]